MWLLGTRIIDTLKKWRSERLFRQRAMRDPFGVIKEFEAKSRLRAMEEDMKEDMEEEMAASFRRSKSVQMQDQLPAMPGPFPETYRQGDVLLIRVGKTPSVIEATSLHNSGVILAYGEHTGHAHVLEKEKVKALVRHDQGTPAPWDAAAERYIQVLEQTDLRHLNLLKGGAPTGEHANIKLEPGLYRVVRQREATDNDDQRWVQD